eukprot:COSAG05_NODE_23880_length_255_cov_0.660256_2_plen_53_part_01
MHCAPHVPIRQRLAWVVVAASSRAVALSHDLIESVGVMIGAMAMVAPSSFPPG